jgi:hypothetical protein
MKKVKKLSLSRETLRVLESPSLAVAGAAKTQACVTSPACTGDTCDCTFGCTMFNCPPTFRCIVTLDCPATDLCV